MHPKVICTPHLGASTGEAQEKVAVEVAEQFVAFAESGEVRNPVNAAPVSGEMRTQLTPWLELAGHMGSLLGQLVSRAGHSIDSLKIEIIGESVAPGATPCTSAALVGLLRCFVDQTVNDVNARILAEERGLSVSEVKVGKGRDLSSGIALTAECKGETYTIKGTLYHSGDRVDARIVQINEFLVDLCPEGTILVVRNQDRPGVIGAVGTLLGERGINVSSMHVAHNEETAVALALWRIDSELEDKALAEIRSLPLIGSATIVRL
jgi:D-3-phosphoglycerate dehydrogenase